MARVSRLHAQVFACGERGFLDIFGKKKHITRPAPMAGRVVLSGGFEHLFDHRAKGRGCRYDCHARVTKDFHLLLRAFAKG